MPRDGTWVLGILGELREQIRTLQLLERRLRALSRGLSKGRHDRDGSNEICSLIVGLPEEKRFRERNRNTTICADSECKGTDAACHRRQTKCEWFPFKEHDSRQLRGLGKRGVGVQLLLAALALFVRCGDSRNISFFCQAAAVPPGGLAIVHRLRLLSRLAGEAV